MSEEKEEEEKGSSAKFIMWPIHFHCDDNITCIFYFFPN